MRPRAEDVFCQFSLKGADMENKLYLRGKNKRENNIPHKNETMKIKERGGGGVCVCEREAWRRRLLFLLLARLLQS